VEKSHSLAMPVLALACLLLFACQTTGTPKQQEGTPTKSGTAAGPQAPPPSRLASQAGTASHSREARPGASAKHKVLKGAAVQKPGKASRVNFRRPAITMRTVLYATLAVILLVVLAAIAAERIGRRNRRLSPSPLTARR
jgi:hypothetical protein